MLTNVSMKRWISLATPAQHSTGDAVRRLQEHERDSARQQPFANYNLGGGLSVGATIEATANWEADEAWTAPLVFNVSKVTLLGKRPVSFTVGAGPLIASPDGGASWRFRLAATFLFPR